jgi:hypothetical protein
MLVSVLIVILVLMLLGALRRPHVVPRGATRLNTAAKPQFAAAFLH